MFLRPSMMLEIIFFKKSGFMKSAKKLPPRDVLPWKLDIIFLNKSPKFPKELDAVLIEGVANGIRKTLQYL
jgi:hypothetical protein